jgi:hypothetical protein
VRGTCGGRTVRQEAGAGSRSRMPPGSRSEPEAGRLVPEDMRQEPEDWRQEPEAQRGAVAAGADRQ